MCQQPPTGPRPALQCRDYPAEAALRRALRPEPALFQLRPNLPLQHPLRLAIRPDRPRRTVAEVRDLALLELRRGLRRQLHRATSRRADVRRIR